MTQSHYVDSVKDNAKEKLDPLFCSMLKHHWLEESQHAKLDTLVVDKLARRLERKEIEKGIDDYMDIGKLLDGGLQTQVRLDIESLQKATGRVFTPAEREEIRAGAGEELPLDVPAQRNDAPELRPEPPRAERRRSPARRGAGARHRLTPRGATVARHASRAPGVSPARPPRADQEFRCR